MNSLMGYFGAEDHATASQPASRLPGFESRGWVLSQVVLRSIANVQFQKTKYRARSTSHTMPLDPEKRFDNAKGGQRLSRQCPAVRVPPDLPRWFIAQIPEYSEARTPPFHPSPFTSKTMKTTKQRNSPIALFVGLALAVTTAASLSAAEPGGTISGRISNAATQANLEGAWVRIEGTSYSATTERDGTYQLQVPAGPIRSPPLIPDSIPRLRR